MAKISGVVVETAPKLKSPILLRDCYGYSVIGDTGQLRSHLVWETECIPFVVEDETGRVTVAPTNRTLLILEKSRDVSIELRERMPNPRIVDFFARHGKEIGSYFRSLREATIEPGSRIVVYGVPGLLSPDASA